MRRLWRVLMGAIVLGLLLTACTGSGADSGSGSESGAGGADGGAEQGRDAGGAARADEAAADSADRQVITTANASLVVDDPASAADEVVRLAAAAGGHVERRTEQRADEGGHTSASVAVRVPADRLTAVLEDIEQLGEMTSLHQEAQDVTQAVRDLDARILALETSVERLLEIMAQAESASALLEAETTLSERQAELEALRSEREYLADQVAMSTLWVDLTAADDPTVEAGGFLGGVEAGWNAFLTFVSGLLLVLGVLLPWLLVLGVPAAVVVWLVRRRRRGRAAQSPPSAPPAGPEPEVSAT